MADPLSAFQTAALGAQIAKTLFDYANGVRTAAQGIRNLSEEVQLTSDVLAEVDIQLGSARASEVLKSDPRQRAYNAVARCHHALHRIVKHFMRGVEINDKHELIVKTTVRLVWPLRSGSHLAKIRDDFERSKNTVTLIITTLAYSASVKSGDTSKAILHKICAEALSNQLNIAMQHSKDKPSKPLPKSTPTISTTVIPSTTSPSQADNASNRPVKLQSHYATGSKEYVTAHLNHTTHQTALMVSNLTAEAMNWQIHGSLDFHTLGEAMNNMSYSFEDFHQAYSSSEFVRETTVQRPSKVQTEEQRNYKQLSEERRQAESRDEQLRVGGGRTRYLSKEDAMETERVEQKKRELKERFLRDKELKERMQKQNELDESGSRVLREAQRSQGKNTSIAPRPTMSEEAKDSQLKNMERKEMKKRERREFNNLMRMEVETGRRQVEKREIERESKQTRIGRQRSTDVELERLWELKKEEEMNRLEEIRKKQEQTSRPYRGNNWAELGYDGDGAFGSDLDEDEDSDDFVDDETTLPSGPNMVDMLLAEWIV